MLSSSGDDLAAETPASDDSPSLDNVVVVTNGRQSTTIANDDEKDDQTSNANANMEPSYQNSANAIRTSITSNGVENAYANTKSNDQTTTTTTTTASITTARENGSASPSIPPSTTISDNNNSEHINGNVGEGKPFENDHSVAAATATGNNNKMEEFYDIPVGEFVSHNMNATKNERRKKNFYHFPPKRK